MSIYLSHTTQVPDGELTVELNDHNPANLFATIDLDDKGRTYLVIHTTADCDRLIRAAIAAKDLLIEATGAQVRFPASLPPELTDPPEAPDFSEPRCEDQRVTPGNPLLQCSLTAGHQGPHAAYTPTGALIVRWDDDGEVIEDDQPPTGQWAAVFGPYCTAGYEILPGHGLLCELRPGHDGPHRSLGYQEGGADITWTGETAPAGAS